MSIGSGNGLSPNRRQAITWINAILLLIRPLGTNFSEIQNTKLFIEGNAFENVVCEMAAISPWGRWVNISSEKWHMLYQFIFTEFTIQLTNVYWFISQNFVWIYISLPPSNVSWKTSSSHGQGVFAISKLISMYRQTSNIRGTLGGNKLVDHSAAVGASPVGAAPTTSSFST